MEKNQLVFENQGQYQGFEAGIIACAFFFAVVFYIVLIVVSGCKHEYCYKCEKERCTCKEQSHSDRCKKVRNCCCKCGKCLSKWCPYVTVSEDNEKYIKNYCKIPHKFLNLFFPQLITIKASENNKTNEETPEQQEVVIPEQQQVATPEQQEVATNKETPEQQQKQEVAINLDDEETEVYLFAGKELSNTRVVGCNCCTKVVGCNFCCTKVVGCNCCTKVVGCNCCTKVVGCNCCTKVVGCNCCTKVVGCNCCGYFCCSYKNHKCLTRCTYLYFINASFLITVWFLILLVEYSIYRKTTTCNDINVLDKSFRCFRIDTREAIGCTVDQGNGKSPDIDVFCYLYSPNPGALGIAFGAVNFISVAITVYFRIALYCTKAHIGRCCLSALQVLAAAIVAIVVALLPGLNFGPLNVEIYFFHGLAAMRVCMYILIIYTGFTLIPIPWYGFTHQDDFRDIVVQKKKKDHTEPATPKAGDRTSGANGTVNTDGDSRSETYKTANTEAGDSRSGSNVVIENLDTGDSRSETNELEVNAGGSTDCAPTTESTS